MANFSKQICVFLSLFLAFSLALDHNEPGFLKRQHSLIKPYTGSSASIPNWDYRDATMITNSFVRLTPDHQGKRGSLWNRIPVYLRDWELIMSFKIHGGGRTLAADGFAIWYTKQRMEPGPVFGSRDQFSGLGVFLDTYKNGPQAVTFPFITAMVNNGSMNYDHAGDGRQNSIGSCLASFRNKDFETSISIRYVKSRLTVSLNVDDGMDWRECFDVGGVTLPVGYFFGVSAATGDLADNHDIVGVKLYEIDAHRPQGEDDGWGTAVPSVSFFKPPLDNTDESAAGGFRNTAMSGFKIFLIFICALLGLGVCVVVGFVVFQKRQEQSRKRFY
uniref:vesicular integral-membrane protein VIP36-like n=1 Tax=Styela clava TaxID=7725 RepID=UPI001939DAA0|nr:vesicular integral-membrane protein VIP36-like [Styela clava]